MTDLVFQQYSRAVSGGGSFLNLMDALYTLINSDSQFWALQSVVGSTGSYECFELKQKAGGGGTLTNLRILLAGKSTGSPAMQSPDTVLASVLLGYLCADGGSYTFAGSNWNNGSAPYSVSAKNIGYSRLSSNATTFAEVQLIESVDGFGIFTRLSNDTTFYGGILGRIITTDNLEDGEDNTGLCYGLLTGGSTAILTNMHSSTAGGAFTTHNVTSGAAHGYMLQPGTNNVWTITRKTTFESNYTDATPAGNRQYEKCPLVRAASPYSSVGELRNIVRGKGTFKGAVADSTGDRYISFAPSLSTADAILFETN